MTTGKTLAQIAHEQTAKIEALEAALDNLERLITDVVDGEFAAADIELGRLTEIRYEHPVGQVTR